MNPNNNEDEQPNVVEEMFEILINEDTALDIERNCNFTRLQEAIKEELDLSQDSKIDLMYYHHKFKKWVVIKNDRHVNSMKREPSCLVSAECIYFPIMDDEATKTGGGEDGSERVAYHEEEPQQQVPPIGEPQATPENIQPTLPLERVIIIKTEEPGADHIVFTTSSTMWNEVFEECKSKLGLPLDNGRQRWKLQVIMNSNTFQDVQLDSTITSEETELVVRIVADPGTIMMQKLDENGQPLNNGTTYFQPTVSTPTSYEKQTYQSDLKLEEFVAPEKKLPGFSYKRFRHGLHKKSHIIDHSDRRTYPKHRGHEPRIMKAQEERYNQQVEEAKNQHSEKQRIAIEEDSRKAQEFEQNENSKIEQVSKSNIQGILDAGWEGGKTGLACGLATGVITNSIEIWNGRKSVGKGIYDAGKTAAKSGGVGYVTSSALSAVSTYGVSSGSKAVATVSSHLLKNTNVIIPVLFVLPKFHEEVTKYWRGEISGPDCRMNLLSIVTTTSAGVGGSLATASFLAMFVPGIGTVAGAVLATAGGVAATMLANSLLDSLKGILKAKPEDTLQDALLWFGLNHSTKHKVNQRYKALSKIHHPDGGGTNESFIKLQTYYSIIVASVNNS